MENTRCYLVIDMKSFFASVECAERGLDAMTTKLIVADKERTEGTVCLAVSPALKKLGVKNRCRLFEVPKDIGYIIAKPRMNKYIEYASNIYAIYLKYICKDDIHVYSIDECFLDITSYLKLYKTTAVKFAKKLMREIEDTLHIPSSAGIGTNLYLAKIALDITAKNSPDRIGYLTKEKFIRTLWKHTPLTDFWGIANGTLKRLLSLGITTMEGIAKCNPDILYKKFGINAEILIDHSLGIEPCLMQDIKEYKTQSKSISSSQILPCGYCYEDAKIILQEMILEGCYRLSNEHYITNLLTISISYQDDRFAFEHASKRFNCKTNLSSIIEPIALDLFAKIVDRNKLVRKIGFSFSNLLSKEYEQYDMFIDTNKVIKEHALINSILSLKVKFGKNAILRGCDLYESATAIERNKQIGGHNGG